MYYLYNGIKVKEKNIGKKNIQTALGFIIQKSVLYIKITQLPRGAESIFSKGWDMFSFSFQSQYSWQLSLGWSHGNSKKETRLLFSECSNHFTVMILRENNHDTNPLKVFFKLIKYGLRNFLKTLLR